MDINTLKGLTLPGPYGVTGSGCEWYVRPVELIKRGFSDSVAQTMSRQDAEAIAQHPALLDLARMGLELATTIEMAVGRPRGEGYDGKEPAPRINRWREIVKQARALREKSGQP